MMMTMETIRLFSRIILGIGMKYLSSSGKGLLDKLSNVLTIKQKKKSQSKLLETKRNFNIRLVSNYVY